MAKETSDQFFKIQEECLQQLIEDISPLFSENFEPMLDHFYSKQEALKISEAMSTHQFY